MTTDFSPDEDEDPEPISTEPITEVSPDYPTDGRSTLDPALEAVHPTNTAGELQDALATEIGGPQEAVWTAYAYRRVPDVMAALNAPRWWGIDAQGHFTDAFDEAEPAAADR